MPPADDNPVADVAAIAFVAGMAIGYLLALMVFA